MGKPPKPAVAPSDVLEWEAGSTSLHPNQKPLGAVSKILSSFSNATSSVLDPFCGSGTTLVAAKQFRRRAVGIEIEERFCEVAAMRLSQQWFDFDKSAFQTKEKHHDTGSIPRDPDGDTSSGKTNRSHRNGDGSDETGDG
jgi:adenine specific DNA methylase Mod